ncbi:MAG TPA: hypothetical protein VEF06_02715 [Bryobacteraceae bacterium]|nr:hypothetical protein [Bryobacteraceae bacterium]
MKRSLGLLIFLLPPLAAQNTGFGFLNNGLPVPDAHNCYPYEGQWADRLQRALQSGYPIGVEQDLAWYVDPATGKGRIAVTHTDKPTGSEPGLRDYFFEPVRPIVEKALRENDRAKWPLIVLHFDFKDTRPELLHAVWQLLGEYESWITTAQNTADRNRLMPFEPKPLLVLTEDSDAQEKVFFDEVPAGAKLRLFGSAHTGKIEGATAPARAHAAATLAPEYLLNEKPTNYRRWWNNSWAEVEEGGQPHAGDWTAADEKRLRSLVDRAHQLGFWIRFYTLDGFTEADNKGWSEGYNFGSRDAAMIRWKAAAAAGVNLIATDQYEDLARVMRSASATKSASARPAAK